jgi:cobalamin biosynthesis protein CobT
MLARSKAHKELLESKMVEEDEDEEEEEESEEEEGEEEAAEEEAEEAAEEEEEAVEEEVYPPPQQVAHAALEDRYFQRGENLRNKFNEVELDSFMKLLNVKPHKQWQDTSVHHYKLGVHTYEDDS